MRNRAARAALACTVLLLASAAPARASISLVKVGDFAAPTYVTAPPHDTHRLFVVEQAGTVRLLRDGVLQPTPFLDLTGSVSMRGSQGLLSIAFAPDYAASGRFYAFYTVSRGTPVGATIKVVELRRSVANPDVADPASSRTLITVDHPHRDHYGGQLQFGPDGMLYVGMGDGGGTLDPDNNAQRPRSLLGKILRIDPRATATAPYRIPADNPFANAVGGAPEVWAYGLRNPWRFSFDRLAGDLVIGDVGEKKREEVDWAPAGSAGGLDYGWRCREGGIATPGVPPCHPFGTYAPPVFEYGHSTGACAITGGYVVRDPDLNGLYGRYLYADQCTGRIRSLVLARPAARQDSFTGLTIADPVSFGEGACGRVYVASYAGEVDRIAGDRSAPCGDDRRPPALHLAVARWQQLGRRPSLHAAVRCDEPCQVTVSGTLVVARGDGRYPLPTTRWTCQAGPRTTLDVKLPGKAARAARKALAAGRHVSVRLVVAGRDASGNTTSRRRTVLLSG